MYVLGQLTTPVFSVRDIDICIGRTESGGDEGVFIPELKHGVVSVLEESGGTGCAHRAPEALGLDNRCDLFLTCFDE